MEKLFDKADDIIHQVKEYLEVRMEETTLEVADKTSSVLAGAMTRIVVSVIVVFVILFASIAVAFALGEIWAHTWTGFLAVAGFYGILGAVIWSIKEQSIRIPIFNKILKQLTRNHDDDKECETDRRGTQATASA